MFLTIYGEDPLRVREFMVVEKMAGAVSFCVSLVVDVATGKSWGDIA